MKIAITGANGFVGSHLCETLINSGYKIKKLSRSEIENCTEQTNPLLGQEVIIHLAARTHQKDLHHSSAEIAYARDNQQLSEKLARLAISARAKRFIYLSSIKALTESTLVPAKAADKPKPEDAYGKSKLASENLLKSLLPGNRVELVIIRPPLIWGKNVKGNLQTIGKLIDKGIPLPVGGIDNKRDLVSVENLCNFIGLTIEHPKAAGETFLVSDGIPRSSAQIFQLMESTTTKKLKLFSLPIIVFKLLAIFPACRPAINRITGNLEVDISATTEKLGWTPQNKH